MKRLIFILLSLMLTINTFAIVVKDTVANIPLTKQQMNYNQFKEYLLGKDMDWILYLAAFTFVFIGLIIKWYIHAFRGAKTNPESPNRVSMAYFVKYNLFKKLFSLLANFLIAFVTLRFSQEMFNIPISMVFALVVGLAFDYLVDYISKLQNKIIPKLPNT